MSLSANFFYLLYLPATWIVLSIGLVIGSFLNVCIYRIPRNIFWYSLFSRCCHCKALIPFWLNIPIISYCMLRGRSKCCNKKISLHYPLVELITAVSGVFLFWNYFIANYSWPPESLDNLSVIRFVHAFIFVCILIICSFIDMRFKIIPDKISLPMIAVSPVVALVHPELDLISSLLGVVLGAGIIYAIAWTYYILRRQEGIGMGDAKLLAGIGGWLGYQSILPSIFYASILGTIAGIGVCIYKRSLSLKAEIPFGPFLAIGSLIFFLIPQSARLFLY